MMPAANARHAMAERRIETHAGALQVCVTGHGRTPLVLWHALFADPSMFEPLVERLAPNYRLLLVAAPGHGASGLPADRLTSAASGAAAVARSEFGARRQALWSHHHNAGRFGNCLVGVRVFECGGVRIN